MQNFDELESEVELIEKTYWIDRTVEEHHFSLEEALEMYGMSNEDYLKYRDQI